MKRIRRYSELRQLRTFEDRYNYLKLAGEVGSETFGFDRWINQAFYTSSEWKRVRSGVLVRDNGCDLGVPGHEIFDKVLVHHMNPMTIKDVANGADWILDPNFLITTTHDTHNAIHYGSQPPRSRLVVHRRAGDTTLW